MNQSTLRYGGLLQAAVTVGFVVAFEFVRLADPLVAGTLSAAGAILTAGSVESVAVGPAELSWRGWYAGGMCLLAGTAVATPTWQTSVGTFTDAEALLSLVAHSVIGLCLIVYAWMVVRRPETLDFIENVDRRIQIRR